MLLIPREPQPWPRILGQKSALSRGMPGNSRQVHAQSLCGTASLEAGIGKGQRFCGHKFVGEGDWITRDPDSIPLANKVLPNKIPRGTRPPFCRRQTYGLMAGAIFYGCNDPWTSASWGGHAKLKTALGVGCSPRLQLTFVGNCSARHRRAAPDPPHGRAHSLPPRVRRGSHRLASDHPKKPKANLHQIVEESGDAACNTNAHSGKPNCFCQVTIKCLGAFCQSLFDLLGEQSHL